MRPKIPPLTLHRRLVRGELLRRGPGGGYHALTAGDGEPYLVREELLPGSGALWRFGRARRPLACVAHLTDLQLTDVRPLTDVRSPAQCEPPDRRDGLPDHQHDGPRSAGPVPPRRPQEALAPHAVLSMIDTLNRITASPVTGASIGLAVTTGDAIDNARGNELQAFLALLDGGVVKLPLGLLRSPGLSVPWLACYGSHEALAQGVDARSIGTRSVGTVTAEAGSPAFPTDGSSPACADPADNSSPACADPADNSSPACADPACHPVTRRQFVEAHLHAAACPAGHGFTTENLLLGTTYFVHDLPGVRFVGLDTTQVTGGTHGALDIDQLWWLQARLAEVHSTYRGADGLPVTTAAKDRLVVIFSHHGTSTLTSPRGAPARGRDLVGGAELLELLHRFPNVVLWLNGHTHANEVQPRIDPLDPGHGFWEVTTGSIADWPCQARLVELVDLGDGTIAVACTMVDHDSPLRPPSPSGAPGDLPDDPDGTEPPTGQLAALHRELAGNVPGAGFGSPLEGRPTDRNVVLPLRAPFDLRILD